MKSSYYFLVRYSNALKGNKTVLRKGNLKVTYQSSYINSFLIS